MQISTKQFCNTVLINNSVPRKQWFIHVTKTWVDLVHILCTPALVHLLNSTPCYLQNLQEVRYYTHYYAKDAKQQSGEKSKRFCYLSFCKQIQCNAAQELPFRTAAGSCSTNSPSRGAGLKNSFSARAAFRRSCSSVRLNMETHSVIPIINQSSLVVYPLNQLNLNPNNTRTKIKNVFPFLFFFFLKGKITENIWNVIYACRYQSRDSLKYWEIVQELHLYIYSIFNIYIYIKHKFSVSKYPHYS